MESMNLTDMFSIVAKSDFDYELKSTLYKYIRDAINYRNSITQCSNPNISMKMSYFVNNTSLYNDAIQKHGKMWEDIDYYAQMIIGAYNMYVNGDEEEPVTPKKPIVIVRPNAPKKAPPQQHVRRTLNFDSNSNTQPIKEQIVKKLEAHINLMDENASKHCVMFQVGNKLVSLRIFDK